MTPAESLSQITIFIRVLCNPKCFFKVTGSLGLLRNGLSMPSLKKWRDSDQTCIDISLGHRKETLRF